MDATNKRVIRFADLKDADQLLKIYKPYVEDTVITFEYEVPSLDTFKGRMTAILEKYPYLVCEVDRRILGYAYASRFLSRSAFEWDVELSVYTDREYQQKGVGKVLYSSLMEIIKLQGVYTAYALITAPNRQSEKFHESFGFQRVSLLEKAGYKHNKWCDLSYYEKIIKERIGMPKNILSINELEKKQVENIFRQYSKE